MKFNKVLFINPFYSSKICSIPVLPTGLGYLAETLKTNDIDYDVLDMALGYNLGQLKRRIREYRPDLIGFSMMTYRYKNIYRIIAEVKKAFPGIKIACGGPHASNLKEKILQECPAIDYGVTFEGEETVLSLAKSEKPENIKGLVYRDGEDIFYTGDREFITDLDRLPFPKYEKFELKKYRYGISIATSRGCPYSCIYCSCHLIGKKIRFRSPRNVIEEIKYWYGKGFKEFGLQEDNPTFDKQRMYQLCDELEKLNYKDLMIMCGNGVRADRVDREILQRMKQAGFRRLAFGVEGGNDNILKNIKKGTTIGLIEDAIKTACDLGFYVSLFFLVGSPGETAKDVDDSIAISLKYPICDVRFNNLVPIPGTELFTWVEANNYFVIPPEKYLNMDPPAQMSNCAMFATPEFPASDRVKMLIKTKQIERLIRKRVLEKRLPHLFGLNKAVSFLYTSKMARTIENRLLSFESVRASIGRVRMWVRKYIYEKA